MAQADGTIVIDTRIDDDGMNDGSKKIKNKLGDLGSTATKTGSKLKSALGNAIKLGAKVGVAAIGTATAAIIGLTKQSIEAFAEYEQLAGGVEKIFDKMDSSKIMADAANAYKDLGMSANEYLAVINNVGATFASTMGDAKGYETAKKGLQAISDFASGTGKSVDELSEKFVLITKSTSQYQSIADQFGGVLPATSADFLKAAQAAGLLSDEYTQLTQVPVAEYQQAVTAMLEKGVDALGLTGNTAAEAASTLSGSFGMLSASWKNLITGLADESADLDTLIGNVVESVVAVFKNLIPRVQAVLSGIGTLVSQLAPVIIQELPKLIESLLPGLLSAAASLVKNIALALPEIMKAAFSTVGTIFTQIFGNSIDFSPMLTALNGLKTAIQPFADMLMNTLGAAYNNVLVPLSKWTISEAAPAAIDLLTSRFHLLQTAFSAVSAGLSGFWQQIQPIIAWVGETVLWTIGEVQRVFSDVTAVIRDKGAEIQNIITAIGDIVKMAWSIIQPILEGAKTVISAVFSSIGSVISGAIDTLKGLINFIAGVFTGDWSRAWNGIKDMLIGIWNTLKSALSGIWNGLKEVVSTVFNAIKNAIVTRFNESRQKAIEIATNISSKLINVWNNIKNKTSTIFSGLKDKVGSIFSALKNVIKTPINAIIGFINKLVSGVVNGINAMIRALNRLKFNVPDWVPVIGGKTFGFNIKTLTAPQIPYLASGAVIPPRSEFLAVLGDQKSGTNIETPEKLLRDLFRQEFAAAMGGGTYHFTAQLNRRTIFDEIIEEAKLRQMSSGNNPFELGRA